LPRWRSTRPCSTSRSASRRASLTGRPAHRVFQEVLQELLAGGEPFSVVLADIDDFKLINDVNGHQIGDEALRHVATELQRGLRAQDSVFRVGGEEFCVVLPGLRQADAYQVAERLRAAVAAIACPFPVTVSLGVASHPADARDRDELLACADAALYASKRSGKNRTSLPGSEHAEAGGRGERDTRLALLQAHDPATAVHSARVATLAVEVAHALGLEGTRLADLRTAARLHDIGKIGVPEAILAKPGPLDDDEFRIIKTHPVVGATLLRSFGLSGPAEFVREHHERIDGTGYPAGLRGEESALESRIIHAADAYYAMTLDRPYRPAMDRDAALDELLRHRGTQFDAAVVDALVGLERSRRRAAPGPARMSTA
jgi:diguanylate cyclase (GGDEF)-like protein/putative nucleotidyltransferase with HDIG domain